MSWLLTCKIFGSDLISLAVELLSIAKSPINFSGPLKKLINFFCMIAKLSQELAWSTVSLQVIAACGGPGCLQDKPYQMLCSKQSHFLAAVTIKNAKKANGAVLAFCVAHIQDGGMRVLLQTVDLLATRTDK